MKAVEPVVTSVIPADVAAPHFTGHSPRGRFRFRPEMILIPGVAVLLIGGWEAACRLLKISDFILPAPSGIAVALYQGFMSGQFVTGLFATMSAVVLGFLASAAVAFVLGTLISQIRLVEVTLFPYVVAIQTLPKIAIAPLILIWFGVGLGNWPSGGDGTDRSRRWSFLADGDNCSRGSGRCRSGYRRGFHSSRPHRDS